VESNQLLLRAFVLYIQSGRFALDIHIIPQGASRGETPLRRALRLPQLQASFLLITDWNGARLE
jgi:hypothetical protein